MFLRERNERKREIEKSILGMRWQKFEFTKFFEIICYVYDLNVFDFLGYSQKIHILNVCGRERNPL